MTTIAVVAMGAMGSAVAGRLRARGARVLTSLEGRSEGSRRRAQAAGIEAASQAALAGADVMLSVVPPDRAIEIAAGYAQAGGAGLFVDCNAINPATAREVGAALAGCRARYVDGSIIGGPPKAEGAGPTFYVAGDDAAEAAAVLGQFGLVTKTLPGGIGAASALKMSYAGITKGFTALGTAMILAAAREGAGAALAAELEASQPEFLERLRRAVPDMLPKSYRWSPEMREIAGFVGDGPGAAIYDGMATLYERVAVEEELRAGLEAFSAPSGTAKAA